MSGDAAILNDGIKESTEIFRFSLTSSTGLALGTLTNTSIMLMDNDPGAEFESRYYWAQENEGTLTVNALRGSGVDLPPFKVNFATTDLSAIAGQDYADTRGTLTFAAGETCANDRT